MEVPIVPIYIQVEQRLRCLLARLEGQGRQEKIHPQALIENLRDTAKAGEPEPEIGLFDDFDGVKEFRQKIDFYSHDLGSQPKWANRMILGNSLLVMTSLAEKEGLKGKVQMIYMDPPYGIDFGSNWQVSTRKRVVKDGRVEDLTRQPEQITAFRDTWKLGVHSYLAYLRDRLRVALDLLTETGSLFLQIGDENLHLARSVMDEVFGSENAHPVIAFRKKMMPLMKEGGFESVCDYVLWYQKNKAKGSQSLKKVFKLQNPEGDASWNWVQLPDGQRRQLQPMEVADHRLIPDGGRVFSTISMLPREYRPNQDFVFELEGHRFPSPKRLCWSTTADGMRRIAFAERLQRSGEEGLRYVYFHADYPLIRLTSVWMDTAPPTDMRYVVETTPTVLSRLIACCTNPGDLVLDPTCGSGTTAVVAESLGRRWITIDTSRVALALARARLMAAIYPYYLLKDSAEGRQKEAEITGSSAALLATARAEKDIKKGFLYRRAPHITLGAIANNEEIDSIHARYEEKLVPLGEKFNRLLKKSWQEWEVPREPDSSWPDEAKKLHAEWSRLRGDRQKEIDDSFSRHANTELLFDQPYEDGKRIRVTGPFTVESLSPHRVLSANEERPSSEISDRDEVEGGTTPVQFETMILENLRKAGVQNTRRSERLVWQRLEPFAGAWLQAAGEYADAAGTPRRVAISIGPEHGTVGQRQIQEAAKEALKGVGFDLLLVLGFAFDAHASEVAKEISPKNLKVEEGFVAEWEEEYGRLPVLLVKMNPDLSMGDELLKKTGAGNLFMVFGEPDVTIARQNGKIVVEIKGLDVYDPTTGVIRSSSADDIACWFLDTNYDEESFFVRHAYFTGAGDPYERLKRALRAEIDEAAWASLYSTVSRPFDPPSTGKIAIKVINHYGDEVLKVFTDFPSKAAKE